MALGIRALCKASRSCRRGMPHSLPMPTSQKFLFRKQSYSSSNTNPLLLRLLQVPNSRVKMTLDQEMPSLQSSQLSWDFLVTSLCPSSSEKASLVLEWILEKMLKENKRDHSLFSELITLCGKLQNVSLGMRVFTTVEANGVKPDTVNLNALISACLSSHDILTALSLFEIMDSSEGYKPDFETYDIFISAFSKSGNVNAMLCWYSAKNAKGHIPDLQMFESLIIGCINSGNFEIASRIFEEMMISKIVPSVSILESMLKGICKQKSLGRAEEFFKFVVDAGWGINENMADMLLALYHQQRQVGKMEELLEAMEKASSVTDSVLLRVHCGIVRTNAALDRLDDAEFAVGRMLKQGLSFASTHEVENVISAYFRAEAYDRLDIFLDFIKSCHVLTKSTYDLLISGYRRAGLQEKVDSAIEDMNSAGLP